MNNHDHELLSSYLDGELSAEEEEFLQQRLQADPVLQQQLNEYKCLNQSLKNTFNDFMNDPVPEKLQAMLEESGSQSDATLLSFRNKLPFMNRLNRQWITRQQIQIAASILFVISVTFWFSNSQIDPEGALASDQIFIDLAVSEQTVSVALNGTLSSQQIWLNEPKTIFLKPFLSFKTKDNQFCREYYLTSSKNVYQAVACLENNDWKTKVMVLDAHHNSSKNYHTASTESSKILDQYIEERILGDAFGKAYEQQLIEENWQIFK